MTTSIVRALVCATGLAVAVAGCSTPSPERSSQPDRTTTAEQPDQPDQADVEPGLACTEIGNAEYVRVDLADVLNLEGGDYFAQISLPATGANNTTGFAGNDEYYPGAILEANLDGKPIDVQVVVRDEADQVVYTGQGSATPELNQPNGARCDGENYLLNVLATSSGDLVPLELPPGERRRDARGRESVAVSTACGLQQLDLGTTSYVRVGDVLGGPDGPPPGWNSPYQRGWATHRGDEVVYTDDAGHRETFRLDETLPPPAPCG